MTPTDTLNSHIARVTHVERAVEGLNIHTDHPQSGTQDPVVGVEQFPEPAKNRATPNLLPPVRVLRRPPTPAMDASAPNSSTLVLADGVLAAAADMLDDLERVKIANTNRLAMLLKGGPDFAARFPDRKETDADGEERGSGFPLFAVAAQDHLLQQITAAHHMAELELARRLRRHPLWPWVKSQRGVGAVQAARLLAAVGDPYWNELYDRPRKVSELVSYCGYGDPHEQVRRRGRKITWSPKAKMRTYLISESCVRQIVKPCHTVKDEKGRYLEAVHVDDCACSPYRLVYDQARAKHAGSTHPTECVRCGPAGWPSAEGSPRSASHVQAMAYRVVSKELLKDLWQEAKRLHEQC